MVYKAVNLGNVYNNSLEMTFDLKDVNQIMKKASFRWRILEAYSKLLVQYIGNSVEYNPLGAEELAIGMCEFYNIAFGAAKHLRMYDNGDFNLLITINI